MISKLNLENFRSFKKKDLILAPTTVIIGNNGVGKTNVLEAISMLSLTTSWRVDKDNEVVRWGEDFARIVSGERELVIQNSPYLKRMRVDGVSKRAYQVIGEFPTVLFQPEDLQLLFGAPQARRQYLDRVISQTDSNYTRAVLELNKILKQRNRLLKNIQEGLSSPDELFFWDQELEIVHKVISRGRQEFLNFLEEKVPGIFKEMIIENGLVSLHYLQSPHGVGLAGFVEHLKKNRQKELLVGVSLYGPHREDFAVKWGEHPAEQAMSRGQSRALLVALKVAELAYISLRNEQKPILLLDDIFSELDLERREKVFGLFGDYQVIMSATDLLDINDKHLRGCEVIDLGKLD